MATRRSPRFKECRRLGVNVCGHPKAMERANSPAFAKKKKVSEYGLQLIEKQKVKAYYGILEKQMRRAFEAAARADGNTGDELLILLERRLDNLVYRAGFAKSIRQARQMVSHGHFTVDGKKINIPSYSVKVGQTISMSEKGQKSGALKAIFLEDKALKLDYIERNVDGLSAKLTRLPLRAEIPVEIKEHLVVEYYSK
jgi:small subunit ribosomal protein S4